MAATCHFLLIKVPNWVPNPPPKRPVVVSMLLSSHHDGQPAVGLLQNGGAKEVDALDSAFPSKTRPAPPSKEALAAMGEDGSGLSVEDMLHSLSRPRTNPSADPLGNGKSCGAKTEGLPQLKGPRALRGAHMAPAPRILV